MKFRSTLILLFAVFSIASSFAQLPEKFIGNWIDAKSNDWTYGFFEHFAVYQNDFWAYESIKANKDGSITVQLKKAQELQILTLNSKKDNSIQIRSGKGKTMRFDRMGKSYPNYPHKDLTPFDKPTFRKDSVIVVGYFRNLDKIPAQFANRFNRSPFQVSVPNFYLDQAQDYLADIDSMGRFRIAFPVMNMQELFVDWARLGLTMTVEAGDRIFLFVDMMDYIPLQRDSSMEGYKNRPKQVLFMGDNARLNNELYQYKGFWKNFGTLNRQEKDDMTFLRNQESAYLQRMNDLKLYMRENKTLSEKSRSYLAERSKWRMGFDLMQRRFTIRKREKPIFDAGYMDFVNATFNLDNELTYTGIRDFGYYLRDFMSYIMEGASKTLVNFTFGDIANRVKNDTTVDMQTKHLLDELNRMNLEFKDADSAKVAALQEKHKDLILKAQTLSPLLQRIASELVDGQRTGNKTLDSLLTNPNLKELWLTRLMHQQLDASHVPFSATKLKIYLEDVKNPDLTAEVIERNTFYEGVKNKTVTFESSLKNTAHLSEYKDADSLFKALIAPYKGKVIYVDFWGTWCGPCKENMKYSNALKELVKGKEVVFMYFANRSPEDSWKTIIQEYKITGENVVHFRLPDNQQSMIERMFSVKSFPTYMLIDREGRVVNASASQPIHTETAAKQILELLN